MDGLNPQNITGKRKNKMMYGFIYSKNVKFIKIKRQNKMTHDFVEFVKK